MSTGSASSFRRTRVPIATATFVLALAGTGALAATLPPGGTFIDDNGSVHEGNIEAVAAAGITKGCNPPENNRFCPAEGVSRAQMAAFVVRALGEDQNIGSYQGLFLDVPDTTWYWGYVERLADLGITTGTGPEVFAPDRIVSRAEMAAFLIRAFGDGGWEPTGIFTDVPAGAWYIEEVEKLYDMKVTLGCGIDPLRYCPTAPVTRGQMASLLARALTLEPIVPPPVGEGCDRMIPLSTSEIDAQDGFETVEPGDRLCLASGTRESIDIRNLHGLPGKPITIVNAGGVVEIDGRGSYAGIEIENSSYIRVTGTGQASQCGAEFSESEQRCGIRISGSGRALAAMVRTEQIEVDHVEMRDIEGSGVTIRDNSLGRGEWVLKGADFHDNFLVDIGGEGMYIGSSDYETGLLHVLEDVTVLDNLVLRTGRDGLQVGSATARCRISGNVVRLSGQNDESNHRAGIMNNKGSVCDITQNLIEDSAGWGIYVQGNGGNRVVNNVIIRAGRFVGVGDSDGDGIAIHTGSNSDRDIYVWNNTIVAARGDGIGFHSDPGGEIVNNIVAGAGADLISGSDADVVSHNIAAQNLAAVGFVDASKDDYRLTPASPAVDAGVDLTSRGVGVDHDGVVRPRGRGIDIGAYESY